MVSEPSNQPVYLVDQDEIVRDSLKVLLESHGFVVRDFADAGAFLRTEHPPSGGCLVLGCNRNIVDGLELIDAVRKLGWDLPAVFIVGGGGSATKVMIQAAGAFAYLERPVHEAALVKSIREALARGRGAPAGARRAAPAGATTRA